MQMARAVSLSRSFAIGTVPHAGQRFEARGAH
jgi:hypothetical protein